MSTVHRMWRVLRDWLDAADLGARRPWLLRSMAHPLKQRNLQARANGYYSSILFRRNNL